MSTPPRDGWPEKYDVAARKAGRASWAAWVEEIEGSLGRSICGRMCGPKAKRKGKPCDKGEGAGARHIRGPVGPCKHHGGLNAPGEASPQYVHGRRIESPAVVGPTLRSRVEAFLDFDPRRVLQVTTATLMARFEDLLDRLQARGAGPETTVRLRALFGEIRADTSEKRIAEILIEARELISDDANSDQLWRELYEVADLCRGSAETYRKVLSDAGEMVERSRALLLFDQLGRDAVAVIEEMQVPESEKKRARLRLAGMVAGYVNRKALPARVPEAAGD